MTRKEVAEEIARWGEYERAAGELYRHMAQLETIINAPDQANAKTRARIRSTIRRDQGEIKRLTEGFARVDAEVQKLRLDEREIIRRRYGERQSMIFIATMMGISERTAYSRCGSAIAKIREALEKRKEQDHERKQAKGLSVGSAADARGDSGADPRT